MCIITVAAQHYYPSYDIGLWTFSASVFGGSFGVFAGGFFSDRLVKVEETFSVFWTFSYCFIFPMFFTILLQQREQAQLPDQPCLQVLGLPSRLWLLAACTLLVCGRRQEEGKMQNETFIFFIKRQIFLTGFSTGGRDTLLPASRSIRLSDRVLLSGR